MFYDIIVHNIKKANKYMDKKPGLLFAVCLLAIIVLATAFGFNFGGDATVQLRAGVNPDSVLYICPLADDIWDSFASALSMGRRYIYIGFCFAGIILLFSWGWALYQNLVKDKFSADAYKNPWGLTKMFFWAAVICVILVMTPNYFRKVHVHVNGHDSEWVLCDNTSTDARAVNADAVTLN